MVPGALRAWVHTRGEHLNISAELPCVGGEIGVSGQDKAGSLQISPMPHRLLLQQCKTAVCVQYGPNEERVVEIVGVNPTRRIQPGQWSQEPNAVDQLKLVQRRPPSSQSNGGSSKNQGLSTGRPSGTEDAVLVLCQRRPVEHVEAMLGEARHERRYAHPGACGRDRVSRLSGYGQNGLARRHLVLLRGSLGG